MATLLGAPGAGKSTLVLDWLDRVQVPSLYISLDTSLVDQAVRYVARRTGASMQEVELYPVEKTKAELERIESRIRFFGITVRTHAIGEVVAAETEYWGEPPAIVVIDNMKNLVEKEEGAAEYERIISDLHRVVRDHNTFILALHHIVRPMRDSKDKARQRPVMMTDGMYAGERDVNFVFGIWRPREDQLRVAILKNRMGRDAPDGSLYTTLDFHGDTARVEDMDSVRQWIHSMGQKA